VEVVILENDVSTCVPIRLTNQTKLATAATDTGVSRLSSNHSVYSAAAATTSFILQFALPTRQTVANAKPLFSRRLTICLGRRTKDVEIVLKGRSLTLRNTTGRKIRARLVNRSTVGAIFLRFQSKMTIMTIIASWAEAAMSTQTWTVAEAKGKIQRIDRQSKIRGASKDHEARPHDSGGRCGGGMGTQAERKGNLAEFLAASPLRGSGLKLKRLRASAQG